MAAPIKNLVPGRVTLVLVDGDREMLGDLQDLLAAERRGPVTLADTVRDAIRHRHAARLPYLKRKPHINGN